MQVGWERLDIPDNEMLSVTKKTKILLSSVVLKILSFLFVIYFLSIVLVYAAGPKEPEPKFYNEVDWGEKMLKEAGKW